MLALSILVLATGCAGTVTRPDPAEVEDSRPVFLIDHGRHSSLVLTRHDHTPVRYVYGDWRWYARMGGGPLQIFPTLFIRTQGALGRRELEAPAEAEAIRGRIRVEIRQIHHLPAPARRVDRLIEALDRRFDQARDTRIYNEAFDLEFVHDPKPYTLTDNSNHVVARWLEELGIDVSGDPVFGRWRVEQAPDG